MNILVISLTLLATLGSAASESDSMGDPTRGPAATIIGSLQDPALERLANDVLARNPGLAVLAARARAVEQRAPQVRSLPDPTAALTLFLQPPQTRVGPQHASIAVSQRLPWFGKLKLAEQAALLEATAAWTEVAARGLELLTKVRELTLELRYLDREQRVVLEEQTTLEHYEELAQARYASGVGIGQTVIKIQAEITRARSRLLDIEERRAALVAELNALRDRPGDAPVEHGGLAWQATELPPLAEIQRLALAARPELLGAQARTDAATARIDLAKRRARPDLTLGLSYALVGRRTDSAGRREPPAGNGEDVLGLSAGINLPIWGEKIKAGVEEAVQQRLAAEETRRMIRSQIEGALAGLARRLPLLQEQRQLFDQVLTTQAEESLRSAETAYAAGTASALDLLDAERILLGVRIAAERARTDLDVAVARLEGVAAVPLGRPGDDSGGDAAPAEMDVQHDPR